MTPEQIEAIRSRAAKATPGLWLVHEWGEKFQIVEALMRAESKPGFDAVGQRILATELTRANATFIAHAREDVPALLAEVDRLTAENTLLKEHGVRIDGQASPERR